MREPSRGDALGVFEAAPRADKLRLRRLLTAERALAFYRPYAKQRRFHDLGLTEDERLLRAGNQQGKTLAGAMETAMHLTGRYPAWWQGRRFLEPVEAWAACDTAETTRDNPQAALLGRAPPWGTGAIPGETLITTKPGRLGLINTASVRHASGGVSRIGFKSYDQGREAWAGPAKHVIWCDEEPPLEIYGEALARLVATRGMIMTTFTPLNGMSALAERLIGAAGEVAMTIEDAGHVAPQDRARIIAAFPEHERAARAHGAPVLGSGRVFALSESAIACEAFAPPPHWAMLGAMDFGWDHPFAAVKLAHDRDNDCVYVTETFRVRQQTPAEHAQVLRGWGAQLRWAWPQDGLAHDKGSGETLAAQYRAQGLSMIRGHATHGDGGAGFEAGIMAMLTRMREGRLKVFAQLNDWFDEFRLYHRKAGKVVKLRDDLLSATRIGLMMLRRAAAAAEIAQAPIYAASDYAPET